MLVWFVRAIRELVDQPRISIEVEDHGFVFGKQGIEVAIGERVRMFSRRLQGIQIDHVDEADFQIRQALTRMATAPSASCVRISPALATTTSGSAPSSLQSWAGCSCGSFTTVGIRVRCCYFAEPFRRKSCCPPVTCRVEATLDHLDQSQVGRGHEHQDAKEEGWQGRETEQASQR